MPIEFRCTSCSKLLRTPDESAGKKAKCPQCGTVVDVPATSESGVSEDTVPTGDVERDPFERLAAADLPEEGAVNPYASPTVDQPLAAPVKPTAEGTRKGLPWERDGKSPRSFWATAKQLMFSPTEAFYDVRTEGGLVDPMLFALVGGFSGAMINAVYNSVMQAVLFGVIAAQQGGEEATVMVVVQVATQFVGGLVGGTVGVLILLFIYGGLYHLCLMMFKGANHPFEATFRVVAYVMGTVSLIQVIPVCGQYVYGLIGMIYTIIGLHIVQQTSVGKAVAAVLAPTIVCIGLVVAVVVAVMAIFIGAQGGF